MKKKNLLLSGVNISNDLILLDNFVPEFKKYFNIFLTTFSHSEEIRKKAREMGVTLFEFPYYNKKEELSRKEIYFELNKIEKKINFPVQKILFGDPEFYEIYKKNEKSSLTWFIKLFKIYEKIIEEKKIEIHYTGGPDHLFHLIPHFIMRSMDLKSCDLVVFPYYGLSLSSDFLSDITEKFPAAIQKNYISHKSIIKNNPVYYIDKVNLKKHINLRFIEKIYRIILRDFKERGNVYKSAGTITIKKMLLLIPNLIKIKLKVGFLNLFSYKNMNPGEKYIYYPLHYTEDAQIRVKYPEAYNQYELIRNILKTLPSEYKLIVKEHPSYIGRYSLRELYSLSKHPKIVIVNPKISSKEIFPFSEYTLSINSTVGYEALFFKNIVFVLGEAFYKNLPGVIKINSEKELFTIINNDLLIKKKIEERDKDLEKKVKDLLKNSLKSDYENFLNGKDMHSGVSAIALLLKKIAYDKTQ